MRTFTTRAGREIPFGPIGFGGAPLGNMHRALSEEEAQATLMAAWDGGMRYFDTAPLYGHGLSETRTGAFLRGKTDFLLSTKVGRLLEPCAPGEEASGIYKQTPPVRVRFDYSHDGVLRSFEESRARLGFDKIDILYVHDVDARTHGGRAQSEARIDELLKTGGWRALSELRAAGAVKAVGVGVNDGEPCERMLASADPDLFLLAGRYTLLEQGALPLLNSCVGRGVDVVIGGPFNSGILAGRATYDYGAAPADVTARVQRLDSLCRSHGVPLAAAALRFPLAHPAVVAVLAGAQTPAEVRANAALVELPIPSALWQDLRREALIDESVPVPEGN